MSYGCFFMSKLDIRSGNSGSFGVPAEPDEKRLGLDIDGLDSYALERWEVGLGSSFFDPTFTLDE